MTVSSIYDYDKARPSWDPSHHKWPWGSESRSQHRGVTLPRTLFHAAHVYLPFLCFSTFSLFKGKKSNWCLENGRMFLLSSGCSLASVAQGLEHCLSASAHIWPNLGQVNLLRMQNSKKIFQTVSQHSCTSISDWGISLLHPDTKHPPLCVGQETPAQCRARLLILKTY